MRNLGHSLVLAVVSLVLIGAAALPSRIELKDTSLDRPLVLDEKAEYRLDHVSVTGLSDGAALTLAGEILSVTIDHGTFGRVWTGAEGKAAALEAAGAMVGRLTVTDSVFFDAENQLVSLREGSFQTVTFERCRFATSESFLKQLYINNPWRDWPPVTEFYNIERLELLDNQFSNTTVVIHPSVKQVVLRGKMPGLRIVNEQSTQVIRLQPGEAVAAR